MKEIKSLQRHVESGELIRPGEMVRVVGRRHPLSGNRLDMKVPAGSSIEEILDLAFDPRSVAGDYLVHVNGAAVPSSFWRRVRVKPGVTVTVIPLLKGGGNSQTMRTTLSIVVAVAALIVSAPSGPLAPVIASAAVAANVSYATAAALASAVIMTSSEGPIAAFSVSDLIASKHLTTGGET